MEQLPCLRGSKAQPLLPGAALWPGVDWTEGQPEWETSRAPSSFSGSPGITMATKLPWDGLGPGSVNWGWELSELR